jgi:hypothetical protein
MHSLIVALLCLTLFVDSAKACWWLRQHRGRSQVCRPAACPPASSVPCRVVTVEQHDHEVIVRDDFGDDQSDCVCGEAPAESAAIDHQAFEQVIEHHVDEEAALEQAVVEQGTVEQSEVAHATVESADRADSVVVHGPTIVVDASQPQPAAAVPQPASVMAAAAAEPPSPAAAQPMPVASASPAVLPTPTPAQEPIPDLKPAITPQSQVAPASNEQLMLEPAAAAEKATEVDQPVAPTTPMPAAVENLAGGPDMKPPRTEPKEPNLFDLYGDEGDEDAPAAEAPTASPPDAADAGAAETTEDSAAEATATDEPEMTDNDADAKETEAADGESETAEPAASAEEPDTASEADPEQAEADPAAAALTVPNELLRHWSDDSGTHHAQGWLVEVQTDRVRILKVNGRHTTVWTESLSAADRDYVSEVGSRLAAQQQGISPAPSATAGL